MDADTNDRVRGKDDAWNPIMAGFMTVRIPIPTALLKSELLEYILMIV
jgi:hypothetical protein